MNNDDRKFKQYLGDGIYVQFDGYELTLTTHNGMVTTNTIVLETQVYTALVKFVESLKK